MKRLADKEESEFNHHLAGLFVVLLGGLFILTQGAFTYRWPWTHLAVLALGDLHVSPADSNRDAFHEHRAGAEIGLRNIFQLCGARFLWLYRDRFHPFVTFITPLGGRFAPLLRLQSRKAQI